MCQNMLYIWKPIYFIYNDQKTKLHTVINIPVPSSDKIYILCYIPLSQVKHKTIILVIFSTFVKQQLFLS